VVHPPDDPAGPPIYFILLGWSDDRLVKLRDFRYARYAVEAAELTDLR
jgi:RNA polymerase sigma-70 factor (ECF subfamily)